MKPVLINEYEIADYLEDNSSHYIDRDLILDEYMGCSAVLRRLSVKDIVLGPENNNLIDIKKQKRFNKLKTEAPPIFVEGVQVLDGNHRVRAAISKGEDEIWAYVLINRKDD